MFRSKRNEFLQVQLRCAHTREPKTWKDVLPKDYEYGTSSIPLAEFDTVQDFLNTAVNQPAAVGLYRPVDRFDLIVVRFSNKRCAVPYLVLDPRRDLHYIDHPEVPPGVLKYYYGDERTCVRIWMMPTEWDFIKTTPNQRDTV